jgi:4-hydroxybenzoate polyprenyltransferase
MAKIKDYLQIMRPRQWTKNFFCLAGLFLGGKFFENEAIIAASLTFLLFSLISSANYVINDILDVEYDKKHPRKSNRPLPSGRMNIVQAYLVVFILIVLSVPVAMMLDVKTIYVAGLYTVITLLYSMYIKHYPVLDILTIAFGFCLRVLAGIYAVQVLPTSWTILCTFFIAIFLAAVKRRAELANVNSDDTSRPVLAKYSMDFLDHQVNTAAAMTIICYALFTTASGKNPALILTVPIVYYAVMHYCRKAMVDDDGEEPEKKLLSDPFLYGAIIVWMIAFALLQQVPAGWFK